MKTTLLALLAVATGCAGAAQAGPNTGNTGNTAWSGSISSGDTVYVRNVNGKVRVVPGSGNKVTVSAVAKGGAKVEVVPQSGGVTICGVPKAKSYTCAKNGELTVHDNDSENSKVDLEITVPKSAVLDVSTVNGGVKIEGAGTSAKVETVNGGLVIATNGPVQAETVNGGIEVTISARTLSGNVELETVNGSIHVKLPSKVDADLEASLVHGKIATKRTLSNLSQTNWEVTGRLGKGGHRIALETVNGSIELD